MRENRGEFQQNSKNSALIMMCTAASRLLGVVRISLLSSIFGASGTADVINFTYNIPNNFRKLLAEGALSSAFIPSLTRAMHDEGATTKERSMKLVREMFLVQIILFVPLVLLSVVFREQIIVFLSDFTTEYTINLASILLPLFVLYLALISYVSVMNALLNSHGLFILAAAAPLSYSVSVIASLALFSSSLGAFSFPLGVLTGGVIQMLLLMRKIRAIGYSIAPAGTVSSPYTKQMVKSWGSVTAASLILVINQQVTFYLASSLDVGSVTAFSNAVIFWQLPFGLFFNSAATVYFPKMSSSFHAQQAKRTAEYADNGFEYLFTFLLPSTLLLLILSRELVSAVLLRGAYTIEDTLLTAKSLRMFSFGLYSTAAFSFIQRLMYAVHRFKTALTVTAGVAMLDIGISLYFVFNGYDVSYLALAHTLSFTCGVLVFMIYLIRTHTLPIRMLHMGRKFSKIALLNIPYAAVLALFSLYIPSYWQDGGTFFSIIKTTAICLAAGGILLVSYHVGGVEHVTAVLKRRHTRKENPSKK
ncbi:MAG: murein biosynthesis integral membrane protein MurJ [Spirochaetota bacterium]